MFQPIWLKMLHRLPPELAHRMVVRLLQFSGSLPDISRSAERSGVSCLGLIFPHRLGVAAGLDKDALAYRGLMRMGFGSVEVGTVTPLPQVGNPLPRLFRLLDDHAVINRMGFNNRGIDALVARVQRDEGRRPSVLGINIGPNKNSPDPVQDYVICFERALPYADYFTINLSSPNTPGLRAFQRGADMHRLLKQLRVTRDQAAQETGLYPPMLIKIAPDWEDVADFYHLLDMGISEQFDGFVISNTTVSRPVRLSSPHQSEMGGLSGAPVLMLSTVFLAKAYMHIGNTVPLIGAGGICSASDVILKLKAGASLLQVYSGLSLAPHNIVSILKCNEELKRGKTILCSDDTEGMIGCESQNLDDEEKFRFVMQLHND